MKKINIIKIFVIMFTLISCKHKMECFVKEIKVGQDYWTGIICQKLDVQDSLRILFRENGDLFGMSLTKSKKNKFIYFFDNQRIGAEIDSNYNKTIYYYRAYHENGTFFFQSSHKFNYLFNITIKDFSSLYKDTIKLDFHYKIDSVIGYHLTEQYVFLKGKLAKGKYYSIIEEKNDSVLIKLTYSSMKYSSKNPNMIQIEYFKGDISKYPIQYDKRNGSIYIPNPIKSEAKIEDKQQFWLPKGDKYLVMFYTTKDTSRLLYTKKGVDYIYRDTIPLDYNMFIVDTRQDNSGIVKEFMRKLAFNTSMKYPGKLENRKDVQEMMVNSGCYAYGDNGKLKLVINPKELVKENKK